MTDPRDIVERLQALTTTRNGRGLDPSQYHLTNPDGPEAADTIASLRKQLDDAREAFVEERETNLWNAYNTGHEKDGEWTHMCMSDGEWLAHQCGLDPKAQYYSAELVKCLIPNAAKAALGPLPAPPAC